MAKMSRYLLILLILFSAFALSSDAGTEDPVTVHVKVEGFRNSDGVCYMLLFEDRKGFPENRERALLALMEPVTGDTVKFVFETKPGIYAISVLHDENLNEKLDRTWYGKPVEGFGFSNNPSIGFRAPGFNEAEIILEEEINTITIKINYF